MKETKLKIEYLSRNSLKEYSKNARKHTDYDINAIKQSIMQFGMCDPIGIWSDKNIIVEGHGRFKALTELGHEQIPCIRLDHLTDNERKMYTLVHNKTAENSSWDDNLLNDELSTLDDLFDIGDFGFDILSDDDYNSFAESKPNERERTFNTYNLHIYDSDRAAGKYQMPIMTKASIIPDELIGFNYMKSSKKKNIGVHCFVDDYQIERLWNNPDSYIDDLLEFDVVLTPDYSLYMDMPMSMKIWNVYRSRLLGQYWQDCGIEVIPTVSWAEPATYEFCFEGIPKNSVVAVSTVGVKNDKSLDIWYNGMYEMIARLQPQTILVYGGKIDFDYGKINVKYYDNKVTERLNSL